MDHLVVITDSDPELASDAADEADPNDSEKADNKQAANRPDDLGDLGRALDAETRLHVFAATYTLEADLMGESANVPVLRRAFRKQHPRSRQWDAIEADDDPAEALYRKLRNDKKFISKGEFAHDIALAVQDRDPSTVPPYLRQAIMSAIEEPGEASATAAAQ